MNIDNFKFEMEETPEVYHHTIWCEKYRPSSLNDFIGSSNIKESLKLWIEKKEIPNILLYGSSGVGKCLDFEEEIYIEMELSDIEAKKLKKYIV